MKSQSIGLQLRSLNNLIMRSIEKLPHKKQVESITGIQWVDHRIFVSKPFKRHLSKRSGTAFLHYPLDGFKGPLPDGTQGTDRAPQR